MNSPRNRPHRLVVAFLSGVAFLGFASVAAADDAAPLIITGSNYYAGRKSVV